MFRDRARPLGVIGWHELRSRLRDGTAVLIAVVAPVLLAAMFGFALGGDDDPPLTATIGVVDLDGGEFPANVRREALASPELENVLTFTDYDDEAAARAALDRGDAGAVIVFPAGFSDSVQAGDGGEVSVLESPEAPLAGVVARSMVDRISALVRARTLAVRASLAAGVPADEVKLYVEVNGAAGPDIRLASDPVEGGAMDLGVYFGAGMAVLFAYFVAGTSVRGLLTERQNGTLGRMRAAPVPLWTIVGGKALVGFSLALTSMCATWLSSVLLFGTSWGDPLGLLVMFTAHAFAATALVFVVASGARTDAQADGFVLGMSFVFAFLGGSLVPRYHLPDWLQQIALATPNGWVSAGLTELATGDAGVDAVLGGAGVVAAIGVVAAVLTGLRVRRGRFV